MSDEAIIRELIEIKNILRQQNTQIYRILLLTIAGAFALIGVKLVFP